MFNNNENVGGAVNSIKYFTGLAPIKVLAINPTESKLQEVIGDAATKFDTEYSVTQDLNQNDVRPINFWVQDVEENISPTLFSINLGKDVVKSQSGNVQIVNDKLQYSYASSIEALTSNPNMSWFSQEGIREARIGEVDYYKFITQLLRVNLNADTSYVDILKVEKLDFESVYEGDFSGLRKLPEYTQSKDMSVVMPLIVKEREKGLRQEVLVRADLMYRTDTASVNETMKNSMMKQHNDAVERGAQLSTKYYTVDFMEFDKGECLNDVPVKTATKASENVSWI